MERTADEQTDFERLFRGQGLPIGQCAFQTLPAEERPLPPLEIDPEMEPKSDRIAEVRDGDEDEASTPAEND